MCAKKIHFNHFGSFGPVLVYGQSAESRLINDLLQNRQEKEGDAIFLSRPVLNASDTTQVQISLTLFQVIDLDAEKQYLSIHTVEELVILYLF